MKKNMKTKVIIAIVSSILLISCKEKKNNDTMSPPEISVAKPLVKDIVLTKDYPGYLSAEQTVDIVARVDGSLQSINFKPGDKVSKGQILFVIEPTLYKNAVTQSEAQLKTAKAKLEYASDDYERMKEAIKSDAVSQIQVVEAEASLAEAKAALSSAEAALKTAQTNLSYCYIRAPFTGKIDRSKLDVGNYVSGGVSAVTLTTIYKDDDMYAYFNIADNQWLNLAMDSVKKEKNTTVFRNVDIKLGKDSNQIYSGVLDYLSPNVDLSTGTISLRAKLDNPKGTLKDGLYVSVTLPYSQQKGAILIPDASIATDQLGKYVYIVNDSNIVKYKHITVGQLIDDTLRQVTSGVSPQDLYVTKALLKVRDGMEIKPMPSK